MADTAARARGARVPTVLQLEALECGAASLGMVLAYHGLWMPLVELRRLCGVSRDGSKASAMLKAARALGLDAQGFRYSLDDLRTVPKPAIVYVNANHFVVLERFRRGHIEVNDPAAGRITYTPSEFADIYSGVVLTFTPTERFQPGGKPPRVLRPLAARLSGTRAVFILLVGLGIALTIPAMVVPAFTRIFVDQVLVERQSDIVGWLVAAMLATLAVQIGFVGLQGWAQQALRIRIAVGSASGFVWRVLRMQIGFFAQRSAATISARNDFALRLADQLSSPLPALFVSLVSALMLAALMAQYNAVLAALGVGVAVVAVGVSAVARQNLSDIERKSTLDGLKLGSRTMHGLMLRDTIKASGSEDGFIAGWTGLQANVVHQHQRLGRLAGIGSAIAEGLVGLGTTAILVLGGWMAMEGQLTLGLLLAFLMLQGTFFGPVRGLIGASEAIGRARATLDGFEDVETSPLAPEFHAPDLSATGDPQQTRATALGRVRKLEGRIELRDVTFGYARLAPPLIRNFSLLVEPGCSIALVGASGSGKSTVAKLVAGLYEPWSGTVLVDGVPLAELPRAVLRNSMSVVDQDIAMFTGTIRDNISLWDRTIPEERIVRAAKDAMIHDDVLRRTRGYDDRVEEDGGNFSGGQRQRLEIARALAIDPTILLLDEATSALDPPTEKAVMDNFRRRGCTTIVIAHRLSTVRDCDEIVVVDGGEVVERGTHDGLITLGGAYHRLLQMADRA